MIKFGVKVGLVAGAVYYTAEQGVWRSSEEAEDIMKNINETVKPYTSELAKQIPVEVPDLPSAGETSFLMKHYWNRGVISTFEFLTEVPEKICDLTEQGYKAIAEHPEVKKLFSGAES